MILMLLISLITIGPVLAGGFNISFYQAMEGQEINMVDDAGNVIETVIIDAMGRATFTQSLTEGYSLEMDLDSPQYLESISGRADEGYSLIALIGLALITSILAAGITALYVKMKIEKKYEFLLDYQYNALLDDDDD